MPGAIAIVTEAPDFQHFFSAECISYWWLNITKLSLVLQV